VQVRPAALRPFSGRCQAFASRFGQHLGMSNRGSGRASATRSERRRAAVARRRRSARQAVTSGERRSRSRRRRRIAALVGAPIVLVALVGGGLLLTRDDDDSTTDTVAANTDPDATLTSSLTGTVIAEQGDVLPVETTTDTYRVRYRIDTKATEGVTTRSESLLVRRPFDAHVSIHPSADGTGTADVEAVSNLGLYADITSADAADVGEGLPSVALGDLRLDGVLDDLVHAGLLQPRERREVLGRECQVYRTGQPLESLQLTAPTDTDYADACVDAAGLVLEEVSISGGEAQLYEIATDVDTAASATDADFAIEGEPMSVADGGNDLEPIASDVAPVAGYWTPTGPLSGYDHVGRYLLRTPAEADDGATTTTAGVSSGTVETYVDVYRDGAAFVVVHQGALTAAPQRDTTLGADVDAGALGSPRVVYGLVGSTLVATTDSWFVEITAPMSSADLGALAATFAPAA
jgi:hypothetical protein